MTQDTPAADKVDVSDPASELLRARKEAECQARRNEVILSTTMDCYGLVDMEGKFVDANPAFLQMLGYSREEFLGISVQEIEAALDPESVRAKLRAIAEDGHARFETRQRRKDGGIIDVEVSASVAEIGGETLVFAFERDITARKQAESELRVAREIAERMARRNATILHTTLDGFVMVDPQGYIVDVNPAYQQMLGYSREEFLSLSVADIEALEDSEDVARRLERLKEQGYDRFETVHCHKDGTLVDVEVSVTRMQYGDEPYSFAFVRDITARRRAEKDLLEAKEAAEKANTAKSEFLSRMSHELRTPMNAILGFSQILEREELAEEQLEYIREISKAGDHLLDLIDELLDMSRIETGNMAIDIEAVDVRSVIKQALAIVQPKINQRELSLSMQCDSDCVVLADRKRLKQVLVNLLDNAIKYNCQGGALSVQCRLQGDQNIRVTVTDSGRGIKPENLSKLFVPFQRLGAECDGIEGTGIGLALTKQLIEEMAGEIGVESQFGQGSDFWIELPIGQRQVVADAPVETEAACSGDKIYTVVCVEDNPVNMLLIQAVFRKHADLRLIPAATGEEGLELIMKDPPDIVILDIQLPGMGGLDVLRELKKNPTTSNIPLIALTADAMSVDVEQGLKAGFCRYFTKPLDIEKFIDELREVIATL